MNLPSDKLLKVIIPLYGIFKSGLHWYLAYTHHLESQMWMFQATVDPFVLLMRVGQTLEGLFIFHVDPSMILATAEFMKEEQEASYRYNCKPRMILPMNTTVLNGSNI